MRINESNDILVELFYFNLLLGSEVFKDFEQNMACKPERSSDVINQGATLQLDVTGGVVGGNGDGCSDLVGIVTAMDSYCHNIIKI